MVIFSLNGVLVDTLDAIREVYRAAFAHLGLDLTEEHLDAYYHSREMASLDQHLIATAQHLNNTAYLAQFSERRDQVIKDRMRIQRYATRSLAWLPQPRAIIDWLPLKQMHMLLEASSLSTRFRPENVVSFSGGHYEDGLVRAAKSLGRAPSLAIVVESNPELIPRATALGFEVIGIALPTAAVESNQLNSLSRAGAALTVPDFRYLRLAVDSITYRSASRRIY